MAEAASGKKKEKAAPAEKSGGTRLGAKVERARGETAYGFLVNVFRAYYLLVLPYTIAVPLLFDVAFSSFLFFFFLDSFFFFFSRYLAISGLMPPVIFPRIVSFDTSNFILRVLHARITRICCHFLSSLLFIFFSPFLLDDNDEPLLAVVIIIKESRNPEGRLFFFDLSFTAHFIKFAGREREEEERRNIGTQREAKRMERGGRRNKELI